MMRVVFMGTPDFATTVLRGLASAHEVVGVFSRPDAVRGRGGRPVASPVKRCALDLGLSVSCPGSLRSAEALDRIRSLNPDVICVAAYGALLPADVLSVPRFGCLNVHASLLPRWRGAAPVQRAILAGDSETGVCIMRMEEGLDTGPYCKRVAIPLDGLYLAEAESRIGEAGTEALLAALDQAQAGTLTWTEQDAAGATYASKVEKGELDLDPDDPVRLVCAKVRASGGSAPARARIAGRSVTVLEASPAGEGAVPASAGSLRPGEACFVSKRLLARAHDGFVEIERVKPDGKNAMDGRSFAAGIQGMKDHNVTWGRS